MVKGTAYIMLLLLLSATLASCVTAGHPAAERDARPGEQGTPGRGNAEIEYPLQGDRFLVQESVSFRVRAVGGAAIQWQSSIDGPLGSGFQIEKRLSPGQHEITAVSGSDRDSVQVGIFQDLGQLYRSAPSRQETGRVEGDFTLNRVDGRKAGESWDMYGTEFNQQSDKPSRVVALARLDILRRQRFSQPLPFGAGAAVYDNLKASVRTLNLGLDCGVNTAGGRAVNLNRNFSVWDSRLSGDASNPDACKAPLSSPSVADSYLPSLYLLVHEGRHCETGDPGHVSCKGNGNMDQSLEPGSGHARATLYLMWVYKYGLFDPPAVKEQAGQIARSILATRFCSQPAHSNPSVQAVLRQLADE